MGGGERTGWGRKGGEWGVWDEALSRRGGCREGGGVSNAKPMLCLGMGQLQRVEMREAWLRWVRKNVLKFFIFSKLNCL